MTLRLLRFRLSVERICRFTRANYLCDLRESYRITITQIIVTARISDTPPMTGDKSRKLKVGDRVQWDNVACWAHERRQTTAQGYQWNVFYSA
jgi:hypothetical protein